MSWPDHNSILYALGTFLSGIAALMLLPALADLVTDHANWTAFVAGMAVTGAAGGALMLAFRTKRRPVIGRREGFLLITLTWVVACGFSALPFMLSHEALGFADAFFEATSGLTTTGSTIMVDLDGELHGILLWRALLHWVGGIGIIVLAVMMLPYLRVGGMQLFRAESSDKSDKIRARASEVTWEIFSIYAVLTLLCAISFILAGMPLFDAVCHAMSTMATGGFANKDASLGFYQNAGIEWVTTIFTLVGGMTFALMARAVWHGDWRGITRDSQTRWYFGYMILCTVAVTLWQVIMNDRAVELAFRSSAFAVVSLGTTTGFVTEDYTVWGPFPTALFIVLLFVGGCTGSTTGAIKVFRFCILGSFAKWQMRSLIHQHRVLLPTYNGVPVSDDVVRSVIGFIVLYLFGFALLGTGVAAFNVDMTTAFSGVAQALGNVGPGFGTGLIGPAGNFSTLPEGAKWLLSAAMLLGRLELLTVLVLFTPTFWRVEMQRAYDILERLIAFPSVSSQSNLTLIQWIRDYLAELGVAATLVPAPDGQPKANLWATIGPDRPGGIVLSGHTDVVPVEDQPWSSDPFTLIRRDGKFYGRGTSDMKGFIALALALVPDMLARPLKTPIHLAFSYDEELGCLGAPSLIAELGRRFHKPSLAIIGEPTSMRLGTRHKGCYSFETDVIGRDGHSSQTHKGANAIVAAAEIIGELERIAEDLRTAGLQDANFEPPYSTINVGKIHGGTALNIIARHCQVQWDFRATPGADPNVLVLPRLQRFVAETVLPHLQRVAPEADIVTRSRVRVPPLTEEKDGAAEALVKFLTGANETIGMAFATEAGQFQEAGLSAIVCGPGSIAQAHQPDEFIEISQLEAGDEFLRKLIAWARDN